MVAMSSRHATGLFYIFLVAIIWIAASFLVQALVSTSGGHQSMPPFVLTYICNSLFLIYIPIAAIQERKCGAAGKGTALQASGGAGARDEERLIADRVQHRSSTVATDDQWKIWRAAAAVAPVWFLAQLCFNLSLALTSVTSNTILSSPSSLFTFILSVLVLNEKFSIGKLIAVLLTILGTVMVALADSMVSGEGSDADSGVLGDTLALLAAALYACYTIILRIMMPEEDTNEMFAFFGYLGVINAALFAPVLLVMSISGNVTLTSLSSTAVSLALLKGLFDNALSDYLWARAVILVGPTIATVGLTMQVPIAMVVDPLVHESGWWSSADTSALELLGGACILGGFVAINFDMPCGDCF